MSKACTKCHKEEPLVVFREQTREGKKYKRPECTDCEAFYNRLSGRHHKREKFTELEFRQMYDNQKGLCACCERPITISDCQIDHNHATGQIRALVCRGCNIMIGYVEKGTYMTAVTYLEKFC